MLGTWLDASEDSLPAFVRESVSLALAGVRERARVTSRIATGRLIADALRGATLIWIAVSLAGVPVLVFVGNAGLGRWTWLMLLWPILAVALVGYDRAAGAGGVAWIVGTLTPLGVGSPAVFLLGGELLPLAGFVVMLIVPRRRRRDVRQLGWLVPVAASSLVLQPASLGYGSLWATLGYGSLGIAGLALMSVAGLMVFATDPRLAVACALVWTSIGMTSVGQAAWRSDGMHSAILFTASGPLMIALASTYLRVIRRSTTASD